MSIGIDEIFEMLDWNNDIETQKKGIEEGKKIKHLSVLIQQGRKNIWENCAKIIAEKSDEELKPYLTLLFEWLQDANWPGYNIIFDRLKIIPDEIMISEYTYSLRKSFDQKTYGISWIDNLIVFAHNKNLYVNLTQKEKNKVKKYIKKHKLLDLEENKGLKIFARLKDACIGLKMKILRKEGIKEEYIKISLLSFKYRLEGNYRKENKQNPKLKKLFKYLKENIDLAKEILPELFTHENIKVREISALHCIALGIYIQEAQKILYNIINYEEDTLENRIFAFDTKMTLESLNAGTLGLNE